MTKKFTVIVPFAFYGTVEIECTKDELEANDSTPLHDKASIAFNEQIASFQDLDFDGFDMTSIDVMEDEEE